MTSPRTAESRPAWRPLSPLALSSTPVETLTTELNRVCGTFWIEPHRPHRGQIRGAIRQRTFSRFETAVVAVDARSVIRNDRMIRQNPGEYLFLLLQDAGHSRVLQSGQTTDLSPGDLYLADSTRPSEFYCPSGPSRQISLHLPREETVRRLGRHCTGGTGIQRNDPLHTALTAVLQRGLSTPAAADGALGEALLNLLGAYFHALDHQTPDHDRRPDAAYADALRQISRHAIDPDFNLAALAAACGLSRRTVQRLFERNGDTVSGRLLSIRLETAWTRLQSSPGGEDDTVSAIAFDCGFNDLSYFYRTFRARYGFPPGDVRRRRNLTP